MHGSNFIEEHSETVTVRNCQNAGIAVFKNRFIASFIIIFGTLSFPIAVTSNFIG